tara:strand:+ start:234 stop:449 length:216 start_codon:yes stop_codon:yes gene_type:complete
MENNTLEARLINLNQALSQMMRNSSERQIIDELTTYRIAVQNTLKILTKKQKQTKSLSASEYEDELEKGNF